MASDYKMIEFRNVWKRYGETIALKDINYFINKNEFFVLFGPSGAGKTTSLKIIAGLEFLSSGHIILDGKESDFISPQKRNTRMVFENYALYPHFSVFENLSSPLKIKKISHNDIKKRVDSIAGILKIEECLDRFPKELSGGQKQRVALGRALIVESDIFLLDEPLAHLDAKIRNNLRAEFHNIKSYLGHSTVVYVTHDYLEAISLGDRICVLNNGSIEQIGTPKDIYYKPGNIFISKVMGQPEINLLKLNIIRKGDDFYLEERNFSFRLNKENNNVFERYNKKSIILGVRPQFFNHSLKRPQEENSFLKGKIQAFDIVNYKGAVLCKIGDFEITILTENYEEVRENENIWVQPEKENILLFDIDNGNLLEGN